MKMADSKEQDIIGGPVFAMAFSVDGNILMQIKGDTDQLGNMLSTIMSNSKPVTEMIVATVFRFCYDNGITINDLMSGRYKN